MILFVHSKFIPLNTFVVTVEADWTISRVRGSILHNLAEIGHHKHPFRLKYKDVYLQDKLTLEECEIYDNTVVELVTLATAEELKRDLFYRYIPPGEKPEEPHLKALKREIDIFHKREDLIRNVKLSLMAIYPMVILAFFSEKFWYVGFISFVWPTFWLFWIPGYTYLSGWVGKAKVYKKYKKVFLALLISNLVLFAGYSIIVGFAATDKIYDAVIFGITAGLLLIAEVFVIMTYSNVQLEPGMLIANSLSQFGTSEGLADALKSSDPALKRAAAFELSTEVALGENEKLAIVEKDLLDPLNNLIASNDRYTKEHAAEAVAELLTEESIREHYVARCDVSILSAAVYSQISSSARLEALNAISYLAESHGYSLDCVLSDINIAIDTIDDLSDREMALMISIMNQLLRSGVPADATQCASSCGKTLRNTGHEDIERQTLDTLSFIARDETVRVALPVIDEVFSIQFRTFDQPTIELANEVIKSVSLGPENCEQLLEDAVFPLMFDWLKTSSTQPPEVIQIVAEIVHNLMMNKRLQGRCLEIGLDHAVEVLLESSSISKGSKKLVLEGLTQLELERKRLQRESSNQSEVHISRSSSQIRSVVTVTEVHPEEITTSP